MTSSLSNSPSNTNTFPHIDPNSIDPAQPRIDLSQVPPPAPSKHLDTMTTMEGLFKAIKSELKLDPKTPDAEILKRIATVKGNFQRSPIDSSDKSAISDSKYYQDKSKPIVFESKIFNHQEYLFYNIEWEIHLNDPPGQVITRTETRTAMVPVGRTPDELENTKRRTLTIAKFHRHLVTSALKNKDAALVSELMRSEGGRVNLGDKIHSSSHGPYHLYLKRPKPFEKPTVEIGRFKGANALTYDLTKAKKTDYVAQNSFQFKGFKNTKSIHNMFIEKVIIVGKEDLAQQYANDDYFLNSPADSITLDDIKSKGYSLEHYASLLEKNGSEKNEEIKKLFSENLFPEGKWKQRLRLFDKAAKKIANKNLQFDYFKNPDLVDLKKIQYGDDKLDQLTTVYNQSANQYHSTYKKWQTATSLAANNNPDVSIEPHLLQQITDLEKQDKLNAQKSQQALESHLENIEAKKQRLVDVLIYMKTSEEDVKRHLEIVTKLKDALQQEGDPNADTYVRLETSLQAQLNEMTPLVNKADQELQFLKKIEFRKPDPSQELYHSQAYNPRIHELEPEPFFDFPEDFPEGEEMPEI